MIAVGQFVNAQANLVIVVMIADSTAKYCWVKFETFYSIGPNIAQRTFLFLSAASVISCIRETDLLIVIYSVLIMQCRTCEWLFVLTRRRRRQCSLYR